jgi:hypothetical protein
MLNNKGMPTSADVKNEWSYNFTPPHGIVLN